MSTREGHEILVNDMMKLAQRKRSWADGLAETERKAKGSGE